MYVLKIIDTEGYKSRRVIASYTFSEDTFELTYTYDRGWKIHRINLMSESARDIALAAIFRYGHEKEEPELYLDMRF